jgi:hypothetical protein
MKHMQQDSTVSIAASLPLKMNPTSSEIVFCPETNSYCLSLGVNVQLPIHELVEVLLKFNAEHVVPNSVSDAESSDSQSLLAVLPEASALVSQSDSPVYTPKASESAQPEGIVRGTMYPDDDFMRIPVAVSRQDPTLLDYRERAKWHREFGRFFTDNSFAKQEARMDRFTKALERYDQLPVAEEFAHQYGYDETVFPKQTGAKRLSADAPVFTPGSAFASTYASDSVRDRALSETFADGSRRDRVMSNLSYLPPNAVIEEALPEVPVETAISSFWSRITATQDIAAESLPSLEREESRPAECKQM